MASNSLICAHDNGFNRAVTGNDAFYFQNKADVAHMLTTISKASGSYDHMLTANNDKINYIYTRENIINAYSAHFESILQQRMIRRRMPLHPSHSLAQTA
jgi:hypothetical protein